MSTSSLLRQEDWLCLSFLSGIGPARLSRLFTYLMHLENSTVSDSPHSLALDDPLTMRRMSESHIDSVLSYDVLRSLKWPDVTAREAMAYLTTGRLNDAQEKKRQDALAWLEQEDHHLILPTHSAYPEALKQISVAPTLLYAKGNLTALTFPKFGIVGARRCSSYGRDMAYHLAYELSALGIAIVSGGAMGIDTAAHQGALASKQTPSIAVMGTGLKHLYPQKNTPVFEQLLDQGGLLISEYPLTTTPKPSLFPPRNRIISGLSMGVLVAEASLKSGSLISASYALQQNREVFALPGRIHDANAAGCHQLLRQGATLVRNVQDILDECPDDCLPMNKTIAADKPHPSSSDAHPRQTVLFEQDKKHTAKPVPESLSSNAKQIINCIDDQARSMDFDELARATKLNASGLMQALMELELNACLENKDGRYVRL
ncbi:DNA-processing protein DprA [Marinomonas sp. TW1]|uniref:DNA-processing protein DprA n=1 Tax=Marinomonas sp. TW1 TaxID=1561203 RepID=UPI0007AFD7FD|nr:DNA-processing protein DprA [Marinomonas sp. TW1]KZN14405.1 DNA processing protein DprA [Marinomonas sp. TW1]